MENKQFIPDQIQKIKKEIFPIQLPVFDRHGDHRSISIAMRRLHILSLNFYSI